MRESRHRSRLSYGAKTIACSGTPGRAPAGRSG